MHTRLTGGLIVRIALAFFSVLASFLLAWTVVSNHLFPAHASSQAPIREIFARPDPWGIAFDKNSHVWLAQPECDPSPLCSRAVQGVISEYSDPAFAWLNDYTEPAGYSSPVFLAIDGSGNIWFTEPMTAAIGELIPDQANPASSTWNQWQTPSGGAPFDLAFDSSGKLWFTEVNTGKIGEFDPASQQFIAETPVPTANSLPYGISGPDPNSGSMWFTENSNATPQIGSFFPPSSGPLSTSAIKEYKTNSGSSAATPHLITFDGRGDIWWTEGTDGEIGRLVISKAASGTDNGVTEYKDPGCVNTSGASIPCQFGIHTSGIAVDSSGTVWFDDSQNAQIGSFVPSTSTFTLYATPTANSHPHDGLAIDSNNNVWFAEEFADQLGEVLSGSSGNATPTPTTASPSPSPSPVSSTAGPVAKTWYFAEGRVGSGFQEYLTIDNPDPANTCKVNIQYLYVRDGSSLSLSKTVTVTVNASQRISEAVNSDLGIAQSATPAASDAAIVSVNSALTPDCQGVVAERPLYMYNYHSISSGSDVPGETTLNRTFYFPDVPTGSGYTSYLTILNPGSVAANVTATYYASGRQVLQQKLVVPPDSRGTISPNGQNLLAHVGAVVTSDQPVAVERPDYFSNINGGKAGTISGAADIVGAPSAASDWLFAEGFTGNSNQPYYQENLIIANFDPTATASVSVKLEFANGTSQTTSLIVTALSQTIWNVNQGITSSTATPEVSADISATGAPIVVEREMFFQYHHTVNNITTIARGGNEILGQPGPASKYAYSFSEGYTATGYNEWLTVQNPTASAETINVTLFNTTGKVYTFSIQIGATTRSTVDLTAIVAAHMVSCRCKYDDQVSMTVQSTNNAPFVAERPQYWNTSGTGTSAPTQGGTDIIGYTGG